MSTLETYLRMTENGMRSEDFELKKLLYTISFRVNRQLEGYFYPEYAMYMENPQRILNTFMVRHNGFGSGWMMCSITSVVSISSAKIMSSLKTWDMFPPE